MSRRDDLIEEYMGAGLDRLYAGEIADTTLRDEKKRGIVIRKAGAPAYCKGCLPRKRRIFYDEVALTWKHQKSRGFSVKHHAVPIEGKAAFQNPGAVPRSVAEAAELIEKPHNVQVKALLKEAEEQEKAGNRIRAMDLANVARMAGDSSRNWTIKKISDLSTYRMRVEKGKRTGDAKMEKENTNNVLLWERRLDLATERGVIPPGYVRKVEVAPAPAVTPTAAEVAEPSEEELAALVEDIGEEQAEAPPPPPEMPEPKERTQEEIDAELAELQRQEPEVIPPPEPEAPPAPPSPTPFTPKAGDRGLDRARANIIARIKKAGLFEEQPYKPLEPARSLDDILKIIAEGAGGIIGQDAAIRAAVNALRSTDFFFAGPAGSGKSSIAQRLSQAMLNRQSLFVSVDPSWFPTDLTASLRPDAFIDPENAIQLGHSLLSMLMGQWLVLDEATRADMGIYYSPMMLLRSLGHFTIPLITERPIYAPNWFRVVATANLGDEGTYRRPDAIKDRFAVEYIAYPAADVEVELMLKESKGGLRAVPAVDGEDTASLCRKMVAFASNTRSPESGFNKGISTRGLIGIGRFLTNGLSVPVAGGGMLYAQNEAGQAFCLADAIYSFIVDSVASEGRKEDLRRFIEMWEGTELASAHPNATRLLKTYVEVQLGQMQPVKLDIRAKTADKVFAERRD